MSNNNQLGGAQALNSFLQQQVKHIEGQSVRVYPFKIVSGLSYFTNRGQKPLGTNFGSTYTQHNNTAQSPSGTGYGAYTGVTTMFSGSKPLMCYWFGVTNATIANGTCTITINADWAPNQPADGQKWKPNGFTNPITNQYEMPWKEVGLVGYSINASKERHSETLDNLKVGCYETSYDYTVFSNDWVPNFQEINEFVYFIIDVRCACPLALRIESVEPHYDSVGILQDCQITFTSVNQYYNQSGRNVLTYIKFGAVGDGYAFPQEVIENGGVQTYLDMNLLNPSDGGVNQVEVKNNALTGQFGALIYGHRYQPFNTDHTQNLGVISKSFQADEYLIPYRFTPPIADKIDVASEVVHSSYDLMMNMIIVNEQIWDNWKKTREFYNLTQNFTFQGGLSFDDPTSPNTQNVLYGAGDSVLNGNVPYQVFSSNLPDRKMLGEGYGSKNLGVVMMSNSNGYSLDFLSNPNNSWQLLGSSGGSKPTQTSTTITGFAVPDSAIFDYRGTGYTMGTYNKDGIMDTLTNTFTLGLMNAVTDWFDLYYTSGFEPPTNPGNEILSLTNWGANCSSIMPEVWFALNSWSMVCCHQLEVNYRDGICYTNTQQGQNKLWNRIQDIFAGIADYITGYTPGYANFFLNTWTRTYNLLIPHSLAPLCNQYLNPTDNVYNAIPMDIFANTNDNNTSVGQLKYMSGYQFELTDVFTTNDTNNPTQVSTRYMRYPTTNVNLKPLTIQQTGSKAKQAILTQSGTNYQAMIPENSLILFGAPAPAIDGNGNKVSFVIDEINVKQLGISNLHISYYKDVKGSLESVGEEWLENTAKMMNNTSYIDNDIQYYTYEELNTTVETNSEPYVDYQVPFDPMETPAQQKQVSSSSQNDMSVGWHFVTIDSNCPVKGVDLTDNTSSIANNIAQLLNPTGNYTNSIGSAFSGWNTASDYVCYATNKWAFNSVYTPSSYGISSMQLYSLWGINKFTCSDSDCPTTTNWIYPTTNQWWVDECKNCSEKLTDGYLSGSIEAMEMDGIVAGVQPWPGTTNISEDTSWDTALVVNIPYYASNTSPYSTVQTGLGVASCYVFQMAYYKFNFEYLLSTCLQYLTPGIPILDSTSSNNMSYGFVLIPQGTSDPKKFIEDNWNYAQTPPSVCPYMNQKTTLFIIEPQGGSGNSMNNNAVLYNSSYGKTSNTPLYGLDWYWYGGVCNPTFPSNSNEYFNTNPVILEAHDIDTANTWSPLSAKPWNWPNDANPAYMNGWYCAPQVPMTKIGMGASCMYQACSGGDTSNVFPQNENPNWYWNFAKVKSISVLPNSGITIPSYIQTNLVNASTIANGEFSRMFTLVDSYILNNEFSTLTFPHKLSDYKTYAGGKYDIYFVYYIYN